MEGNDIIHGTQYWPKPLCYSGTDVLRPQHLRATTSRKPAKGVVHTKVQYTVHGYLHRSGYGGVLAGGNLLPSAKRTCWDLLDWRCDCTAESHCNHEMELSSGKQRGGEGSGFFLVCCSSGHSDGGVCFMCN